ncbi:MAG: RNA polymerase sigma factor [Clostridia bacterium]|nr:RNA polymerase sigma factor [Clostridia bacterium]
MNQNYDLTAYADRLYAAALRRAGNSFAAEEIAQDTFLAALQSLHRGKQPDDLWAWLQGILAHKHAEWLRQKYNHPTLCIDDCALSLADDTDFFADEDNREQLEALRRAVGYLAHTHREVIVRFYLRGEPIEQIAAALGIPAGTVKSRLHTGRQQLREGVITMKENYVKQSYAPERLTIGFSGVSGQNGSPSGLVDENDRLAQNILILAYPKSVTEAELAAMLGIPAPYIEPVVERLVEGELMARTDGGRVYTDFIIYTFADQTATLDRQIQLAETQFDCFWNRIEPALAELREQAYYLRQSAHARAKLELHFVVKLLHKSMTELPKTLEEYPYRKDGGRWYALGHRFAGDEEANEPSVMRYRYSGEAGWGINNFRDAKHLELQRYDTILGQFPCDAEQMFSDVVKWLWEIHTGVARKDSAVSSQMLESAGVLIKCGVLTREGGLTLDIPVMTMQEYDAETRLIRAHRSALCDAIRDIVRPLYKIGRVKLPAHLTNIPAWQQYLYCDNSLPMAVIHEAIARGRFLSGVDYPIPAAILVAGQ